MCLPSIDLYKPYTIHFRVVRKDQISKESQRKKRKLSPKEGKHIPIDVFFAKSSQNF